MSEVKIESRGADRVKVSGYVNAVGRDSMVLPSPQGNFVEQVVPGTFEKALRNAGDIELRFNHKQPLGSVQQGNLKLKEDAIGLYAEAEIYDWEIAEKARRGELRGWSFTFVKSKGGDRWEDVSDGLKRRYLEDIDLREVSVLDIPPAYIGTSIEVREQGEAIELRCGLEEVEVTAIEPSLLSNKHKEIEILKLKGQRV